MRATKVNGTAVTSGTGTGNTVAKFSGPATLTNSSITDNGTTLSTTDTVVELQGATATFGATVGALALYGTTGISFESKIIGVNNINAAGNGVPGIFASYATTANTGAVTNAINYTPPAAAGRYRLSWAVDTTTATTDNFTVVVTWTNPTGSARSQNSGGFDKNGTALTAGAITNTIGAGAYYGSMMVDIDNSATAITLSTAGTFTTVTYNLAATLEQLA